MKLKHKVDNITFGVVEECTNARFIFTDEDDRQLCVVAVPVKGFTTEGITLSAHIDDDMIARIKLQSTHMAQIETKEKEFNELKFYYDLDALGLTKHVKPPQKPHLPTKNSDLCAIDACNNKASRGILCDDHFRYEMAESK